MSSSVVTPVDAEKNGSKYAPRTVRSVSHAIQLVRTIASSDKGCTLSELSRRIGLSKPSVYSLLNSLVEEGLVRRDVDSRYHVGWGSFELASQVEESQVLEASARSILISLASKTQGAVLLSVANQDEVLYVDREQRDWSFNTAATVGRGFPWHATASGKALLAYQSSRTVSKVLNEPLVPSTTSTVTAPEELFKELQQVKERGFATCWGEHEPLLSSLAVPVFDHRGTLRAALAVAVPTDFLRSVPTSRIVNRLHMASQAIKAGLV